MPQGRPTPPVLRIAPQRRLTRVRRQNVLPPGAPQNADRGYSLGFQLWADGTAGFLASNETGITLHSVTVPDGVNLRHKKSTDEGANWGLETTIGSSSGNPLERALYAAGSYVHVVYERDADLYYNRSTDEGGTWGAEVLFHTGTTGQFYRMAFGGSGSNIYVIYTRINDGSTAPFWRGQMYFRRSTDNGATWSAESEIYPNGAGYESAIRPNMAVSPDGSIIHITWAALQTGNTVLQDEEINTGRSLDGGLTWEPRVIHRQPPIPGVGASRPEIYATGSGALNLFWQEGTNFNTELDLYTKRSTDNGQTWSGAERFAGGIGNTEHIYTHARGERLIAAFADYRPDPNSTQGNGRLQVKYSEDGGATWSTEQRISETLSVFAPIAHISANYIHLLTADSATQQTYYRAPWLSRLFRVATSDDDGYVDKEGTSAEWPPSGTITNVSTTAINLYVRKARFTGFSNLMNSLLRWDTNSLPDDIVPTSVKLRMVVTALGLTTRNLLIDYYDPNLWPIDLADWIGTGEGSSAGNFPLSGLVNGDSNDLTLSAPTNINKGGYTALRLALDGGQPVLNNDHQVGFASFDNTTATEPQLIVDWTPTSTGTVDADTVYVDITPSGVEVEDSVDSSTVYITITPSGVENAQFVDTNTVPVVITPSAVEFREITDAGTVYVDIEPSSADVKDSVDSSTIGITITPSATEGREIADAGTIAVGITPSGSEVAAFLDSSTVGVLITPSGVEESTGQFTDIGTVTLTLTPSAVETRDAVDANIVGVALTPSAVENVQYVEVSTVSIVITPNSTDTSDFVDAGLIYVDIAPSASEEFGAVDTAQVYVDIQPTSLDAADFFDTNTVSFVITPSSTDTVQFADSTTTYVTITPSAIGGNEDVGIVYFKITPITTVEQYVFYDTLFSATTLRRWNAVVSNRRWSAVSTSKWSAILVAQRWDGMLLARNWSASTLKRWLGTIGRS